MNRTTGIWNEIPKELRRFLNVKTKNSQIQVTTTRKTYKEDGSIYEFCKFGLCSKALKSVHIREVYSNLPGCNYDDTLKPFPRLYVTLSADFCCAPETTLLYLLALPKQSMIS